MRRPAFYSHSPRASRADSGVQPWPAPDAAAPKAAPTDDSPAKAPSQNLSGRRFGTRSAVLLSGAMIAAAIGGASLWAGKPSHGLTQKDIDAAVLKTLQTTTLPSPAAKAAAIIAPSVVRVVGYGADESTTVLKPGKGGRILPKPKSGEGKSGDGKSDAAPSSPPSEVERGVGTGVVVVDKGTILTNLHVVAGADEIKVTFYDGLESAATVIGLQPENDLAVLQAKTIPDDLIAATMRSTADLHPGDQVAAVGFPFGIGPSVSAGVVSGLKRGFQSPEGKRPLGNLIQFDAAANPGNSGGPLVNMDGEVLGIVTAILNPTQHRTFIGIGFAVPIENAASAVGTPPF